jgi:hypothetical protein
MDYQTTNNKNIQLTTIHQHKQRFLITMQHLSYFAFAKVTVTLIAMRPINLKVESINI